VAVPYQSGLGEWIVLNEFWVRNAHRAKPESAMAGGLRG
jgi:hypothetical protein